MTEVAPETMLAEVRRGLGREQKELSPKFFYDRRGSELFEKITRLPEYYLTRAELRILEGGLQEWLDTVAPASLVEFGAGSGRKTRSILDGMLRATGSRGNGAPAGAGRVDGGGPLVFVPVDVSAEFLEEAARSLRRDYTGIRIVPMVADMSARDFLAPDGAVDGSEGGEDHGASGTAVDAGGVDVIQGTVGAVLRRELRPPALFVLLGSTIGNFRRREAVDLLSRISGVMAHLDRFLLGVDLRPGPRKTVERLERAYNDSAGITARFNRNVLRVLNRELGTSFDLHAFRHQAFYDGSEHRIEMHLEALRPQSVALPDGTLVSFRAGETLRTELSHKYDRQGVTDLMDRAGMELERWLPGEEGLYAMAVGRLHDPEAPPEG